MPVVLWAKTAAGPNLAFIKSFGKALKTWKDVIQQNFLRKHHKPHVQQTFEIPQIDAKERCLFKPSIIHKGTNNLQSRIFRSLFARTTSRSLASELRRKSALKLTASSGRSFRNVSIMSLIGVTLGLDVSTVIDDGAEKMMSEMREKFQDFTFEPEPVQKLPNALKDLDINLKSIASGCEGAVYKAKLKDEAEPASAAGDKEFNLAVKAVFNYGAESNSCSILRALEREIVPLRAEGCQAEALNELGNRVNRLPAHPNIVDMPGIFVDDMLVTEEGLRDFPAAMPQRVDRERCFGRNKTLYLVMKRRNTHLRDYLAHNSVPMATRCLMLAQLLEGVSHLQKHGIAHRDLKTDNILVDVSDTGGTPRLEICDFGCCLAEENKNLLVPYPSKDLYLGGNSWLMAPELVTAQPGPNSFLDYRKSDLWAVGAIAYEILGADNPFYPSKSQEVQQLRNVDYSEDDLPALPDDVPEPIQKVVLSLLSRNPNKRPSASAAIAVIHLSNAKRDSSKHLNVFEKKNAVNRSLKKSTPHIFMTRVRESLNWILVESLSLLCQLTFSQNSETWDMDLAMKFLFLSQVSYADLREASKFF
ncbi:serine/threonine-protein kinase Pink1, mitochondrial-like [Biomphalaria glabrata]|uniref:non-specific serine/threonine protein kinase n=1 Tax=Biomphalaria glabrata TaxID=6526 RepID=A0A9W2YLK7_BIOGL|nr:serine/threonine-protein kinase Pink1, mitochondrial-like [Biomphalaria glabrata]